MVLIAMAVTRVDSKNNVNPNQFSRPRIPATAPANDDEMNFTVVSALLCRTFGG